ncbi:MAG: hypothetical protein COU22_02120 [Candidatus Komeilibacteria bacterium CG10_big_fil_rev_8_21_14_0_10_41_13]|uniref:Uncharacterized protein n=1 Tax=Candidatus Komeilibacteria bacterium CG10_big_fil_rev_8_21_14_0_10_41_13 TaxID=1974476 RepID=A0A2M6WCD8_9BACT|nr:MAG: hypothetical protein COU22_02120 [Candidatus Komeilibacteria bacterium CG10_big_fil_rev_8_21_14_0_10_41_13]
MPENKNKFEDPLAGLEIDESQINKPDEKLSLAEKVKDRLAEKRKESPDRSVKEAEQSLINEIERTPTSASTVQIARVPVIQDPLYSQIEGILSDGLADVYNSLTPEKKQEFKKAGEETSSKITILLRSAKFKVKEVFRLIFQWLKIIPGVNKYYLEQEAKIKADQILFLKKRIK